MAKLLSSWCNDKRIPENYVFPPEVRPGEFVTPVGKACVPIVDLLDEKNSINHLIKASQDHGMFQVVNHGIKTELMGEAMGVFKEVFKLPQEEKDKINMEEDTKRICRIYTSSYNYEGEDTHYWRDALRHSCTPLDECIKYWPQKPENYREIVGPFAKALKHLGSKLLELISQGLGLETDYLSNELSEDAFLTINHYPLCPDPSLTLGLSKHSDPNLITLLLLEEVPGLQAFMDGKWMGVETLPDAFLVFIGNQLEIVSNGKVKSGIHRVVTNAKEARTSAAFFINPSMSCVVEPAKSIVKAQNSEPLYKTFQYKHFFKAYTASSSGDHVQAIVEAFKIKAKNLL